MACFLYTCRCLTSLGLVSLLGFMSLWSNCLPFAISQSSDCHCPHPEDAVAFSLALVRVDCHSFEVCHLGNCLAQQISAQFTVDKDDHRRLVQLTVLKTTKINKPKWDLTLFTLRLSYIITNLILYHLHFSLSFNLGDFWVIFNKTFGCLHPNPI